MVTLKNMKKEFSFSLPVSIFREKEAFIAHTPVLNLTTSGKTFEEAKKRFDEAVDIFFEELAEMGTLDETLEELGWVKTTSGWAPPTFIAHEIETFKMPAFA